MPKGKPDGEVRRWKCTCAYDGTEYAGWQKQPSGLAVQDKIEESLKEIFGVQVRTIGSGRTDAGVHAKAQVFHFDASWTHPHDSLLRAMRVNFPADILALKVEAVEDDFHALLSAKGKRYCYRLHREWAMPEVARYVHSLRGKKLFVQDMQEASSAFVGEYDFSAFSASRGEGNIQESKVRKVWNLEVVEVGEEIHFVAEGNGFLYKMVRSMVGALIDVGQRKLKRDEIFEILKSRIRTEKVVSAPAKGLCLEQVFYKSPHVRE